MSELTINAFNRSGLDSMQAVLARRPYIATEGRYKGQSVITVNAGIKNGKPVYAEKPIHINATLQKDEWIALEDEIVTAARERLVIIEDMRAAGLAKNVGGLGTIISEWENVSEMTDAHATMDGETATDKGRVDFGLSGVPVPIIGKGWDISERMLLAGRTRGASLDVTAGVEAARAVARKSENMVFNGLTLGAVGTNNYQVYGLTNDPNRNTQNIADWSDTATLITPADIVNDILAMIATAEADRYFGPFNLYVPGNYWFRFREDYRTGYSQTLKERVESIDAIASVKAADGLTDSNVVLVQLQSNVIDLAVASDVATVQWASGSGWTNHFQTYAAWAPRIKADNAGRSGIVHGT